MTIFLFYMALRIVKYLVVCSLCLVYVEAGPGGEYVGNIVEAMTSEFSKVEWSVLFESIKDNLALAIERIGDNDTYVNQAGGV